MVVSRTPLVWTGPKSEVDDVVEDGRQRQRNNVVRYVDGRHEVPEPTTKTKTPPPFRGAP